MHRGVCDNATTLLNWYPMCNTRIEYRTILTAWISRLWHCTCEWTVCPAYIVHIYDSTLSHLTQHILGPGDGQFWFSMCHNSISNHKLSSYFEVVMSQSTQTSDSLKVHIDTDRRNPVHETLRQFVCIQPFWSSSIQGSCRLLYTS